LVSCVNLATRGGSNRFGLRKARQRTKEQQHHHQHSHSFLSHRIISPFRLRIRQKGLLSRFLKERFERPKASKVAEKVVAVAFPVEAQA
jgi:hypothetical protein